MPLNGFTSQRDSQKDPLNNENADKFKAFNPEYSGTSEEEYSKNQYKKDYKVKDYNTGSGTGQNLGTGVPSLINRYALFQYKGLTNNNFASKDYRDQPDSRLHTDEIYRLAQNPEGSRII